MRKLLSASLAALFLLFVLVLPSPAQADVPGPDEGGFSDTRLDTYTTNLETSLETNTPSLERNVSDSFEGIAAKLTAILIGSDPHVEVAMDGSTRIVRGGGMINGMGNYLAMMMSNPPARTDVYIADVMNAAKINIAQPAYAQGIGFAALSPVLEVWKRFRDLAYLFFVLIFLVIGFMIMLRKRIGGQAAITVQTAIPKIIVSLIYVTFSYAIAGLLIDLMYLFMFLVAALFADKVNTNDVINANIFSLGTQLIAVGATPAYDAMNALVQQVVGTFASDQLTDVFGFIGGLAFGVVVAVAIAYGVFKLFFELLQTYVTIVINIALAPLLLMMNAIPGQNTFGGWVRSLIGNLAAFPTVLVALIIVKLITQSSNLGLVTGADTSINGGGFLPPYLIGQGSPKALSVLFGVGIILVMPKLVAKVKERIGAKSGPFEQLIGQGSLDAVKGGYNALTKGQELIPGIKATNPAFYGLTAPNIGRKVAIPPLAVAGGLGGAALRVATFRPSKIPGGFASGAVQTGGYLASKTNDKQLFRKARARYETKNKPPASGGKTP